MGFRGHFARQQSEAPHVRFGSKADITERSNKPSGTLLAEKRRLLVGHVSLLLCSLGAAL
jgi:hypothetical protein